MSPISNDLMLAAALTSAVPAALAQTTVASNTPRTGVATTITTNPGRGATSSTMYIDNATNQRLTTDANSTLHVLFADQSALTLGPNSELVIARYEFDNKSKNGQILIDMTQGFLRVVGGLISKKTATVVRTTTATVGIRGGITVITAGQLAEAEAGGTGRVGGSGGRGGSGGGGGSSNTPVNSGQSGGATTNATFLFGTDMTFTPNNGNTRTITRPGTTITPNNIVAPQKLTSTSSDEPADSATPRAVLTFVNTLSSTRQSDPTTENTFVTGGGSTGGGGAGGAPTLKNLLGTAQVGNTS